MYDILTLLNARLKELYSDQHQKSQSHHTDHFLNISKYKPVHFSMQYIHDNMFMKLDRKSGRAHQN